MARFVRAVVVGLILALLLVTRWDALRIAARNNLAAYLLKYGDAGGCVSLLVEDQSVLPDAARRNLLKAEIMLRDFIAADTVARQFLEGFDYNTTAWLQKVALASSQTGATQDAIKILDMIFIYGPRDSLILYRLGDSYEKMGALQQAIQSYQFGVQADTSGQYALGIWYSARVLYKLEKWEDVILLLGPLWLSEPDVQLDRAEWRSAALILASSLLKVQSRAEAERVYRNLINLNPASRDWQMNNALIALGDMEVEQGLLDAAANRYMLAYNIALEMPEHAIVAYEQKARAELEKLADAVIAAQQEASFTFSLRQRIAAQPNDQGSLLLLQMILERQRDSGR